MMLVFLLHIVDVMDACHNVTYLIYRLVADIDKGGVFAQVIGTYTLLPPIYRSRIRCILINKFRGDRSLFDDGVEIIQNHINIPVYVIDWIRDCNIEREDSLARKLVVNYDVTHGVCLSCCWCVGFFWMCCSACSYDMFDILHL